jgi:hypothetical protein
VPCSSWPGFAGLLVGADLLVRSGATLASHLGVRPIVVSLTVVALGTSLPELAVGIDAVRQGSPGLAVGNIVGANLVMILFILGLSALIRPIAFSRSVSARSHARDPPERTFRSGRITSIWPCAGSAGFAAKQAYSRCVPAAWTCDVWLERTGLRSGLARVGDAA